VSLPAAPANTSVMAFFTIICHCLFVCSLPEVPYGLRFICKIIGQLVSSKFNSVTQDQLLSLIGGFFLLRFVNPAIVSPDVCIFFDMNVS
jgi:Ras GTPase-activating-like protein IQGAP2/3